MKKVLIRLFVEVITEIEKGSEMETAVDEMATAVNAFVSPQLEKGCASGKTNNCSFEVKIQEMDLQERLLH